MSSKIPALGDKGINLAKVLVPYEKALEEVEEHLRLAGKTIEFANRENSTWQAYYDERRIELKTLVEYVEVQIKRTRGRLYKNFLENYSRELDHRAIEKYMDNETSYLTWLEVYLEVKEMYQKFQSAVDMFTSRGYSLNNITKLRIASMGDIDL